MGAKKLMTPLTRPPRCCRLPDDDGGQRGVQVAAERAALDGGHVQQPGDEEPAAITRVRLHSPATDQILMKFIILSVIPICRYSFMRLENTDYDHLIMITERARYFEPFLYDVFVTFRAL